MMDGQRDNRQMEDGRIMMKVNVIVKCLSYIAGNTLSSSVPHTSVAFAYRFAVYKVYSKYHGDKNTFYLSIYISDDHSLQDSLKRMCKAKVSIPTMLLLSLLMPLP